MDTDYCTLGRSLEEIMEEAVGVLLVGWGEGSGEVFKVNFSDFGLDISSSGFTCGFDA